MSEAKAADLGTYDEPAPSLPQRGERPIFTPADWYWRASDERVFGSARSGTVPSGDVAFTAWQEAGGSPTPWPRDEAGQQTDAALAAVLAPHGLAMAPADPVATLLAHAANRRFAVETGGVEVGGARVRTDRESQAMISAAFALAQVRPTMTIQFKAESGFVPMDAAGIQIVALAVADHVQACFAKEAEVAAAVESGAITKRDEVDAAFAGLA